MKYMITHYNTIEKIPIALDSFLSEKPAINFEAIGIIEKLRENPNAFEGILDCVVASDNKQILTVTCRIQPFNLLISHTLDLNTIPAMVEQYLKLNIELPGIYGPMEEATAFVDRWKELTGHNFKAEAEFLQYSLKTLRIIPEYMGDISIATKELEEMLSNWTVTSIREIIPDTTEEFVTGCVASFKRLLEKRRVFVLDIDGTIVSMAAVSGRTKKMQAINDVFTPQEYRGQGHATELCTFLADYILNDCKNLPILWVKSTNKAAIHIYEKIGFEKVAKNETMLKIEYCYQ